MRTKISLIKTILFLTVLFMLIANATIAQNNSNAIAAADTSRFSTNKTDGWQLYNSYIVTWQNDSALIELTLQHSNNINLAQEQYVGKIKNDALQPGKVQSILILLASNHYLLRIDKNGKCWLSLVDGSVPADNPIILPLRGYYKL